MIVTTNSALLGDDPTADKMSFTDVVKNSHESHGVVGFYSLKEENPKVQWIPRDELPALIEFLQKQYDNSEPPKITELPPADVYILNNGTYMAQVPDSFPARYVSAYTATAAIKYAKRACGLALDYWANTHGSTFVPIYLTERQEVTTVVDEHRDEPVTISL